jgi:lysophospholipase L1-like esterase
MRAGWLLVLVGCGAEGALDSGGFDPEAPQESRALETWVPEGYAPPALERVVFLGDSITGGWGASEPELTYKALLQANQDATWPSSAEEDLERFGDVEVLDFSIGGATTQTLRDGQLRALEAHLEQNGRAGRTQVFATIGGNDIQVALFGVLTGGQEVADQVPSDIEGRMDEIMAYLTDPARFPDGVHVLFTNVYDPTDDVGQADLCFGGLDVGFMREPLLETNRRLRQAAERHGVGMIDLYGLFQGHGMYADDPANPHYVEEDPTLWYTLDCIHPNDRGHHELRRHFMAALEGRPLLSRP